MSFAEPGLEIVPGITLLRPLGRGGMSEAWLARDRERGEEVVAKVLPPNAAPGLLALLRREARLGQRLSHPGIVPVYGLRSSERGSALTLRYMRGGEARWRGGVPPKDAVRLGREVAEALAYLHGQGVVHRDVKSSNVLLDETGRAHLADFGIAAVTSGDLDQNHDGLVVRGGGSRASMSPQQRAGEPATPADDLYALGAFLFELLAGAPPFPDEPARAQAIAPRVTSPFPMPDSLVALVGALLARSPSERPSSAGGVVEWLGAIESELEAPPRAAEEIRVAPPPVRLQPPPRVSEAAVIAPVLRGEPPNRPVSSSREGLSSAQINLLAFLAVAVVVTVVFLPGWVAPPAAPPKEVSAPSPEPAPSLTPSLPPPPAPPTPRPIRTASAQTQIPRSIHAGDSPPALPAPTAALPTATPPSEPTPDREAEARALASHRDRALAFEANEEWSAALREYEAALAVDPLVAFAVEGKERAGSRAAFQSAMDFHLKNSARLSTEAVAKDVEALLERARGVPAPGPRHRAQVEALASALADARTTITVQLESDGKTELTVSRVGRLGTLTRRPLQLRPGTYVVVGSRPGYRDVRRQFTIAPRSPMQTVFVRCEETI